MKKIKMIATVAVIAAMTVLAGCSKNKDNDSSGTASTATGDVAEAVGDPEGMPSATVLPSAGDDKEESITAGAGELPSGSSDGLGENKEDLKQVENESSDGNVNQDDESSDKGTSSEEASESGNKVNGSQSGSSGTVSTGALTNGNTAGKPAASVKTPTASTTTSTTAPTKVPTAVPTATPTVAPTAAAPTIKSYIILVDKKVETMCSTYGTVILWEFEHDDPEKGYPYITSHSNYTYEDIITNLSWGDTLKGLFIDACRHNGETYGTMLGGYVIGQEEKIVDVDFVNLEDGSYYVKTGENAWVGYSINETIGCVYSDGTKVYY